MARGVLCVAGSCLAQKIIALIKEMGVTIKQILVTHAHFDHFLAAEEIRKHTGAPVGLSSADTMLWQALPLVSSWLMLLPAHPSVVMLRAFFCSACSHVCAWFVWFGLVWLGYGLFVAIAMHDAGPASAQTEHRRA